ncbi:MAG: YitT family protein [Muribaculaceae bacterium]|nr:YitT family protein [Muribaculaceae bacterium]
MKVERRQIWRTAKDYFFITLGVAIYAFGFASFILPHDVVIGGAAGISTILYFTTGLPVAVANYALNLFLLAVAYKVVGKQFVVATMFGATMISVMMGIAIPLCGDIFHLDPFLSCVIGGILSGTGLGMAFVHGGSTGGTDIVAAMVAKHTNVTIGRTMIYVDMCIISSSYLLFHKIDNVVYGFIVLFMYSYMADLMINTNRQAVQFTIFSRRWQEIATAINNEAKRGCTILTGMGWYSKEEVKILLVMARKIESVHIFRIVKSIDPEAFISQANVNGVYGKGFDQMKVRMKLDDSSAKAKVEERARINDEVKTPGTGHGMI